MREGAAAFAGALSEIDDVRLRRISSAIPSRTASSQLVSTSVRPRGAGASAAGGLRGSA
jgi:hypothetical protein